jgi:hypothetical protein
MSFWMVPASLSPRDPLLLGRHDVERQDRQHRAVHGHRHADLVERDALEQHPHVEIESIATPAMPTSPTTRGWSLS